MISETIKLSMSVVNSPAVTSDSPNNQLQTTYRK